MGVEGVSSTAGAVYQKLNRFLRRPINDRWTKSLRDSWKVIGTSAVCASPAAFLIGSREKHPVA